MTNDNHTAAPATSPAAPSREKIPAPTIEPTPMNAACRTVSRGDAVVLVSVALRPGSRGRYRVEGTGASTRTREEGAGLRLIATRCASVGPRVHGAPPLPCSRRDGNGGS